MISRETVYALLSIRAQEMRALIKNRRPATEIHPLAYAHIDVVIKNIADMCNKESKVHALLSHIAFGTEEDFQAAKAMLEANPRLIFEAADVVTPSGLKVIRTTPYECAIGAGDDGMAAMIAPCFERFEGGLAVKAASDKRYRPHIEKMLDQKNYYDLNPLIEAIKQASDADVTAQLQNMMDSDSELCTAFKKFRKDFTPGEITVGMHFNYQDLIHAFAINDAEYDNLTRGDNYDRNRLVARQVIGFIQRNLPAVERCLFAEGNLYGVANKTESLVRTFKFKYDNESFPAITRGDSAHVGLGVDYWVGGLGLLRERSGRCGVGGRSLGIICQTKASSLASLHHHSIERRRPGM